MGTYCPLTQIGFCDWILESINYDQCKVIESFSAAIEPFHLRTRYISHKKFEEIIEANAVHEMRGVRIILAPPGSGKTTIVRHTLQRLYTEKKISGAVVLHNYMTLDKYLNPWIMKTLGSSSVDHTVNSILPKIHCSKVPNETIPYVIVFDQFDDLLLRSTPNELKAFFCSLAQDSVMNRKYTVLLLMKEKESAKLAHSWNDNTKIVFSSNLHLPWAEEEILELVKEAQKTWEISEKDGELLRRFGPISKSPRFVLEHAANPRTLQVQESQLSLQAKECDQRWQKTLSESL